MTAELSTIVAVVAAIISALAAIASAIISALISISVSKRTASQKIAEMRREWIEDLRKHVAHFGSTAASVISAKLHDSSVPRGDFQFDYHYIILLLNLEEPKHNELYAAMNQVMAITNEAILSDALDKKRKADIHQRFHDAIANYTTAASSICREEWQRLRIEIRKSSEKKEK